jgi:uncharacterized SAM-binding protein YcdF (DUF218 family)
VTGLIKAAILSGLVMAVVISAFYIFRDPILLKIGDYLVIQDDLFTADLIHVIAGDDHRTDYAIRLYQQGYAKQIYFTGGWCEFHHYYHGLHGMERALAQGVPAQAIAYDDTRVISTYDEALRLKAFINKSQSPIQSVIVVSDPYHMRRARWTYRRIWENDIEILMAPVPFEQTPYQQQWWEDYKSREYVKDEYKKIIYYIARYQLSWGPVKAWLASMDKE